MKALVLCGGFAKRLLPLTENTPKALLPIKGKPMIEYVLKKIEPLEEIDHIYISISKRFEQQFANFLRIYDSRKLITLVVEETSSEDDKLGAVRGIEFFMDTEKIAEPLLVINGDNLFDAGLFGLLVLYKKKKAPVVGLYDVQSVEKAKNYGVVTIDDSDKVTEFIEKPAAPSSTLASTGIYIFTLPSLQKIPLFLKNHSGDRPGDFVKWLAEKERVYSFTFQGKWVDIGTLEEYRQADAVVD